MTTQLSTHFNDLARLRDGELLERVIHMSHMHRECTAELVVLLGEVEARRLYLAEGCSSLFIYCTQVLKFSEHEAYNRIEAARAARRYPAVLTMLQSGAITLTTVRILRPHLTWTNHHELLEQARYKTKREVEEISASLQPKSSVREAVRRIPARRGEQPSDLAGPVRPTPPSLPEFSEAETERSGGAATDCAAADCPAADSAAADPSVAGRALGDPVITSAASGDADAALGRLGTSGSVSPSELGPRAETAAETRADETRVDGRLPARLSVPRAIVAPLSPERYLLRLTISAETHTKLRYAQNLARHSVPSGDLATILDRALTLFVRDLERVKLARADRPRRPRTRPPAHSVWSRPGTRRIPADVRREVWKRDGGQCSFFGAEGRCRSTGWLEFHHIVPFAEGGPATVENIALRCRAHNQFEGELHFGPASSPRPATR